MSVLLSGFCWQPPHANAYEILAAPRTSGVSAFSPTIRKAWENNNGGSLHSGTIPAAYQETEELDIPEPNDLPYLTVLRQVLMYLGAFVGVLLSSAIMQFRSGTADPAINIPEVILSAVVAFVIIPVVYEKLNLNPSAPFIVQFALFVQNGVFWHMLIDSIGAVM